MTKAILVLGGCLLCCGAAAQASSRAEQLSKLSSPAAGSLATVAARTLLARNGADDGPGDDRGGREGNAGHHRGGHDDGAHHR